MNCELLLHNLPESVLLLDRHGYIRYTNRSLTTVTGYTAQEILDKSLSVLYVEDDAIKAEFELSQAQKQGSFMSEGWKSRKDGSRFWSEMVITAITDEGGQFAGYTCSIQDTSEKKARELELRKSEEQYRLMVEQVTGYGIFMMDEEGRIISWNEGSKRIKGYKADEVNVNDLLAEALQNLRNSVETSGAQVSIESEVETVHGDRVQLMQLIQNLVGNALKFTQSKKPEIRIRCTVENGQPKFAVADNGIGIARGDLHKVFEIFKRLNMDKAYPGTGIGLAICKKIVDRHQGQIWPESEPGKGTTFYFTLWADLPQQATA